MLSKKDPHKKEDITFLRNAVENRSLIISCDGSMKDKRAAYAIVAYNGITEERRIFKGACGMRTRWRMESVGLPSMPMMMMMEVATLTPMTALILWDLRVDLEAVEEGILSG